MQRRGSSSYPSGQSLAPSHKYWMEMQAPSPGHLKGSYGWHGSPGKKSKPCPCVLKVTTKSFRLTIHLLHVLVKIRPDNDLFPVVGLTTATEYVEHGVISAVVQSARVRNGCAWLSNDAVAPGNARNPRRGRRRERDTKSSYASIAFGEFRTAKTNPVRLPSLGRVTVQTR